MNISYNWLKELVEITVSPAELAKGLTRVGLAVEGIHPFGDDHIFDIDLTSNRPDCLSHLGVAREISAFTGKPMTTSYYGSQSEAGDLPLPPVLAGEIVLIDEPELCRRFTARIIRGVRIGPSPEWLVKRLESIGERSINNVADITNFVMHESGQPMHAFDLDKVTGGRIIVRRARPGETVITLDEVERKLDSEMLAICDEQKAISIAGIMGGLDSGITTETTDVLLEVANFRRESIRNTSRRLGLTTEASYRFERGVDIENVVNASDRATQLILELAGGKADDLIDVFPTRPQPITVGSQDIAAAVTRLTGLSVETLECNRILRALGIEKRSDDPIYVAPSWRHDISIEEDLVEEVARHAGYENIATLLPPAYGAGEFHASERHRSTVRNTLQGLGFYEAITYSFIDTKYDDDYTPLPVVAESIQREGPVTLRDSVIEGAVRMRPTIAPGLLDVVKHNFNQQRRDLKLFEAGKVFAESGDGMPPIERDILTIVLTGSSEFADRELRSKDFDFYDLKGTVEAILQSIGVSGARFAAADVSYLQPGQTAMLDLGGKVVGYLGVLNESISKANKFRQPVFIAELDLQTACDHASPAPLYSPLPRYPSVVRDVSFMASSEVTFRQLKTAAESHIGGLLRGVSFVDVYEGDGLPNGMRSITIRFEYRSNDRTLSESEVDEQHQQVIASVCQATGAVQR